MEEGGAPGSTPVSLVGPLVELTKDCRNPGALDQTLLHQPLMMRHLWKCGLDIDARLEFRNATGTRLFLTTFAKTQGEKYSTNLKTQGLFWAQTQRTCSKIAIMNFKTSNICAERAEKMQFLVYFDQISPQKFKK